MRTSTQRGPNFFLDRTTTITRMTRRISHDHDSSLTMFHLPWINVPPQLLRVVLLVTFVVMAAPTTVCAVPATTSSTTSTTTKTRPPSIEPFMEWFVHQEGALYDSARQAITTTTTKTTTTVGNNSRWYTVATQNIEKGAVLAIIPTKTVLMGSRRKRDIRQEEDDDMDDDEEEDDHEEDDMDCTTTVMALARELSLGADSDFAPFLQHLQHQSLKLPMDYSSQGKELFHIVLESDNKVMLMDEEPTVHYEQWEKTAQGCPIIHTPDDNGDDNGVPEAIALSWVSQFAVPLDPSYSHVMIPLVDLYSHRNGNYTNVEIQIITMSPPPPHHDGQDSQPPPQGYYARLVALRDIVQGEQLYISLNDCLTCHQWIEEREEVGYGTPEIFRDHGFIEDYPQFWTIPETQMTISYQDEHGEEQEMIMNGIDLVFRLEQNPDDGQVIQVHWNLDHVETHVFTAIELILLARIRKLHRLKNIEYPLTAQEYDIPPDEWEAIWKFHDAYSMALKRAVLALHEIIVAHNLTSSSSSSSSTQDDDFRRSAEHWEDHYTDFRIETDHIAYNDATCQSSEHTDFVSYQQIELERSNYQEMLWQFRPNDNDTCLHLDGMLQICTSYRPHYHEFFVHYPARYLPDIKRVVFLGSGDAMLLHEILKYPSLEKVVGLELDQTVTRKAFKHFKTQPHYDDPRVEWWYGDATKTLPLLPRDYWGSFDLLLVDLSETVVSLHVTGKHDVLDVISMLLKPEGVMLENELYIDKMSRHFDHSVHIFYGSPKVCVQVHTVSSNSVDFMTSPIYDHGVDMFLIDPVKKPEDPFKFIHDYVKKSPKVEGKCHGDGDADLAVPTIEHGRQAGILMVLEAENCSTPLLDKSLRILMHDVIRKQGLTPLPGPTVEQEDTIQIVMKEGYIIARYWPSVNYVGLDLHFWGAFTKMESVRDALASALGAQTTSSYRVVVGGMHGSSTWEQDKDDIGVRFSQKRNCTPSDQRALDLEQDVAISAALDESLKLLKRTLGLTVAVVCGSTENCLAMNILNEHGHVDRVIPFFPCHGIPDFNDGTADYQPMYDCELEILGYLTNLHNSDGVKIDAFVMDLTAPLSILQIFASIWEDFDRRHQWLGRSYVVALPFTSAENKRMQFMDLYRKLSHGTVTTLAEFTFEGQSDQPLLGWRVFTFDDQNAVYSLSKMAASLKKRIPNANIRIQLLEGDQIHRKEDMELEGRSFQPEDYDRRPNELQMQEQRPFGRQTIFQFEKLGDAEMPSVPEVQEALASVLKSRGGLKAPEYWSDVGHGVVLTSIFSQGNVVLVWDGLSHLDINLFSWDERRELSDGFVRDFLEAIQHRVTPTLRDDQPRGFGGVVNFQSDIDHDAIAAIKR